MFNFGSYVSLPTLFACFLGSDVPTSSFIFIENVFYYSCFHCFFFVNMFCTLQKYWCKLYIMKSYNHIFIKMSSSVFVYMNYLCNVFHLQMMYILYFTYSTVCSPSVCHCVPFSIPIVYTMALILIIIIFIIIRMYLLTRVISYLCLFSFHVPRIPRGSINEYTYENGIQFEIKSL